MLFLKFLNGNVRKIYEHISCRIAARSIITMLEIRLTSSHNLKSLLPLLDVILPEVREEK